jgi:hypothetical protein
MMVLAPRFAVSQAYFVPVTLEPVSNDLEQRRLWIDT